MFLLHVFLSFCPAITALQPSAGPPGQEAIAALSPAISEADLRVTAGFLADDACAGRLTGTPGAERAASFIAAAFAKAGLQPASANYFQDFEFAAGVRQVPARTSMTIAGPPGAVLELEREFRPLVFSGNGQCEGEVLFAGYGLVTPDAAAAPYDSYAGLEPKARIVLVFEGVPENIAPKRRQELSLYASERYKAKLAEQRGASGFLLVRGPNSPDSGTLARFDERSRTSPVSIPAASITAEAASRLLIESRADLKTLQTALDGGELPPHPPAIRGAQVRLAVELERVTGQCRNVLGLLPPAGGVDEYILLGAHYDHIGTGEGLGSLARAGEEGMVHNGADDNASGTAVILELAAALAGQHRSGAEPRRGVVFACWSGEELGLVGSSHFVEHPVVPLDRIKAYFNFDMVGRLREDRLILQSVGSSTSWRGLIERRNIPAGFDLVLQDDPYLPTDATAFYTQGVPALSFFTDLHDDYNRPSDDADTLNYEGMRRVARFAEQLAGDLLRPEQDVPYVRVERSAPAGARMGRRVYTGTVPDFASADVQGVRLADVRPGGPADQAGLRGGDIIVEFAGLAIHNLQDYSDALVGAKTGQEVDIVVLRDGQRVTLKITPSSGPK